MAQSRRLDDEEADLLTEDESLAEDAPLPEGEEFDTEIRIEAEPLVEYDPEAGNLVPDLEASDEGKRLIKTITQDVLTKFRSDWDSTQEYRERVAKDMRLFMGDLEAKTFPWEHCANAHVPIVLENISRLQSRVVAEIFGNWTNVVGVMPVGTDDDDLADLLTIYTNWQFREEIKDFRRQMERAILAFLLIGDVVIHSFYDPRRRCNRHVCLMPEEFITPYTYISTMPDMSDLPHYTYVRRMYPHELEAMRPQWEHVDKLLDLPTDSFDGEPDSPLREQVGDTEGQEMPAGSDDAPYKILQWEGWLKLPNEERYRWCQAIVHEGQQLLLSLSIHEEPDWKDQRRHEREVAERELYAQERAAYEQEQHSRTITQIAAQKSLENDEQDPMQDMQAAQLMAPAEDVPPPEPPVWMTDPDDLEQEPEPVRMIPINMFAHGVCLENLLGNIGMGMGRIEADFNRAANTALSQFIDAATLANCWSIITTQNVNFDTPFKMKPGAINKARGVSGTELKNNIMELKPAPGSGQLLELVDRFYNYGQSAIQAPNVLSGEPGKSGETYRGIATRIEQATKQLSTIAHRFGIPLKQIYENNAKLNAIFMDELEVKQVLNHMTMKMQDIQIGRRMFERDFRVEFRSDMKFTSEAQRISEADQMVQMPAAVPALQTNFAFQYETVKQALEARGKYELVALLGQRPPAPPVFGPPPPPPGPPPGGPPQSGPPPGGPPPGGPPPPDAPPPPAAAPQAPPG